MLRTALLAVDTLSVLERRIMSLLVRMPIAFVLGLPKPPPEPVTVTRFSRTVVPRTREVRDIPVAPILVVLMMFLLMVALPAVEYKIP